MISDTYIMCIASLWYVHVGDGWNSASSGYIGHDATDRLPNTTIFYKMSANNSEQDSWDQDCWQDRNQD